MNSIKKSLTCLVFLVFSFSYSQEANKGTDAGDYSSINPIQRYEVSNTNEFDSPSIFWAIVKTIFRF